MTGDWTEGVEAIRYQRCTTCGHIQYFGRAFCAGCGGVAFEDRAAGGAGTVFAATGVSRAATPDARAYVPYTIVLVDTDEGFRMMAHGAQGLAIGDRVQARFTRFLDRLIPYFERTSR